MSHATPETCKRCERRLVPMGAWRRSDPTRRRAYRETGHAMHMARGLCGSCYRIATREGTLLDYERSTIPFDVAVEEWDHLRPEVGGESINEQLRRVAARVGMTAGALEKALERRGRSPFNTRSAA